MGLCRPTPHKNNGSFFHPKKCFQSSFFQWNFRDQKRIHVSQDLVGALGFKDVCKERNGPFFLAQNVTEFFFDDVQAHSPVQGGHLHLVSEYLRHWGNTRYCLQHSCLHIWRVLFTFYVIIECPYCYSCCYYLQMTEPSLKKCVSFISSRWNDVDTFFDSIQDPKHVFFLSIYKSID